MSLNHALSKSSRTRTPDKCPWNVKEAALPFKRCTFHFSYLETSARRFVHQPLEAELGAAMTDETYTVTTEDAAAAVEELCGAAYELAGTTTFELAGPELTAAG